jgi:uncharacterized membrane protein (Fun14 family)
MFCIKCGEAIPDGSTICPICNASLVENDNNQTVVYASQKVQETLVGQAQVQKKKKSLKVIGIVVAVVVILIAVFTVKEVQKANLKKELLRDWMYLEDKIIKVLDFSDDKIIYRIETGYSWIDTTIATCDYKVVSGNKIKIKRYGNDYITYSIKFNDNKKMLIVTPAITSTDAKEYWFNFD